ncbi:MAG: type II toxin-antitoxin system Phd/YefM family antitoxin [Polyangiaceae bacterium]
MPRRVSLAIARNNLTGLVRDAERGSNIELTRRGKRVAVLVSASEYDRLRSPRTDVVTALRSWRARLPSDFDGFPDLDELRDASPGHDAPWG